MTDTELHVYVIPGNLWRQDLNTTFASWFKDTVSAGIVRQNVKLNLAQFRANLEAELGFDFLPKEYVFCKSVGHSLGRTDSPEVYVIDRIAIIGQQPRAIEPAQRKGEPYSVPLRAVNHETGDLDPESRRNTLVPEIPNDRRSSQLPSVREPREMEDNHDSLDPFDVNQNTSSHVTRLQSPRSSNVPPFIQDLTPSQRPHSPSAARLADESEAQSPRPQTNRNQSHRPPAENTFGTQPVDYVPQSNDLPHTPYHHHDYQDHHQAIVPVNHMNNSPPPTASSLANMQDPALNTINSAIGHQREILLRLENEQQRRLLQMYAEAEERRRREAEAYERELAEKAEQEKRLAALEEQMRRCANEAQAAREELAAAKQLWQTALEAKESEVATLRENLDLMRASSTGRDNAAVNAARAELTELRNQLKTMNERYKEVQDELERRRMDADQKLGAVRDQVDNVRRKMSLIHAAVREPPKVEVVMQQSEHKEVKNIGVSADFLPPPIAKDRTRPLPLSDPFPGVDDLTRLRRLRRAQERRRAELVKRLNHLYVALGTRRTQVRDEWKHRYYTAKRQAPDLEERLCEHRGRLDGVMRRAITTMRHNNPPETTKQHQILESMEKRREVTQEEYRLAEIMLEVTKAIKLRTQAEAEGRLLMTELDRRRGEMSLVKSTSPNRRAYVFSLSPRRHMGPRHGAMKQPSEPLLNINAPRRISVTPRRSRMGSMMQLLPPSDLQKSARSQSHSGVSTPKVDKRGRSPSTVSEGEEEDTRKHGQLDDKKTPDVLILQPSRAPSRIDI